MTTVIEAAVARLAAKVADASALPGIVKFTLSGEGSIMLDANGVREGDEPADVTLTADADVFQAMLDGDLPAMSAFMSGKLKVEGEMSLALKLGSVLG